MNWERSRSLTPLKKDFLLRFFSESQDFYLTGGSALGIFYLDHRLSYDLDLFIPEPYDGHRLDATISSVAQGIGAEVETLIKTPLFRRYLLKRGDESEILDFAVEQTPQIDSDKSRFGVLVVDTIVEIGVNKICALLGRSEIKDLVDLYFLSLEGFHIMDHLDEAMRKEAGIEPAILSHLLSQANLTRLPDYLLRPLDLEDLVRFVNDIRRRLADLAFPSGDKDQ